MIEVGAELERCRHELDIAEEVTHETERTRKAKAKRHAVYLDHAHDLNRELDDLISLAHLGNQVKHMDYGATLTRLDDGTFVYQWDDVFASHQTASGAIELGYRE